MSRLNCYNLVRNVRDLSGNETNFEVFIVFIEILETVGRRGGMGEKNGNETFLSDKCFE